MEANSSEPDIVGYTVREAERLENIEDPDQLDILDVHFMVTTDCKLADMHEQQYGGI